MSEQSISHWGVFDIGMSARPSCWEQEFFAENKRQYLLEAIKPTSFFVSRQDTTLQRNNFGDLD